MEGQWMDAHLSLWIPTSVHAIFFPHQVYPQVKANPIFNFQNPTDESKNIEHFAKGVGKPWP